MKKELLLENIQIEVELKKIKNIHLRVYAPTGRVYISAPLKMKMETIKAFALSRLEWIKKNQEKLRNFKIRPELEFINKEEHFYDGRQFFLSIIERDGRPKVVINQDKIELFVKEGTSPDGKKMVLENWYRKQLKEKIPPIIEKWEKIMNVKVNEFGIKKMKTRWGTCNPRAGRIWLNLELVKRSHECLEYVVVHEMTHILERSHGKKFISLMNLFLPEWKVYKEELRK